MTRKDYVLIAQAIKEQADLIRDGVAGSLPLAAVQSTALRIAVALGRDNPRFDRERFMRACGFED